MPISRYPGNKMELKELGLELPNWEEVICISWDINCGNMGAINSDQCWLDAPIPPEANTWPLGGDECR